MTLVANAGVGNATDFGALFGGTIRCVATGSMIFVRGAGGGVKICDDEDVVRVEVDDTDGDCEVFDDTTDLVAANSVVFAGGAGSGATRNEMLATLFSGFSSGAPFTEMKILATYVPEIDGVQTAHYSGLVCLDQHCG